MKKAQGRARALQDARANYGWCNFDSHLLQMIDVRVLAIQPHPDQATNNPGCWAVRFEVSHNGTVRTFWRWHNVRALSSDAYSTPSNKKPRADEIVARFWEDTFAELHGFSFDKEEP